MHGNGLLCMLFNEPVLLFYVLGYNAAFLGGQGLDMMAVWLGLNEGTLSTDELMPSSDNSRYLRMVSGAESSSAIQGTLFIRLICTSERNCRIDIILLLPSLLARI